MKLLIGVIVFTIAFISLTDGIFQKTSCSTNTPPCIAPSLAMFNSSFTVTSILSKEDPIDKSTVAYVAITGPFDFIITVRVNPNTNNGIQVGTNYVPAPDGYTGILGKYETVVSDKDRTFGIWASNSLSGASLLKFSLEVDELPLGYRSVLNLSPNGTKNIQTGVLHPTSTLAYFGAGASVTVVDVSGNMTFIGRYSTGATGNLVCSVITDDGKYVIFGTTTGYVLKFRTSDNTVVSNVTFNEELSACVKRKSIYGLFATKTSGKIHQVDFNGDDALTYNNMTLTGFPPGVQIRTAAASLDDSAAFFPTSRPGIPMANRFPETVYEIILTDTAWALNSMLQDYGNNYFTNFLTSAVTDRHLLVGIYGNFTDVVGARLTIISLPEAYGDLGANGSRALTRLFPNFTAPYVPTDDAFWSTATGPARFSVTNPTEKNIGPVYTFLRGFNDKNIPNRLGSLSVKLVSIDEISQTETYVDSDNVTQPKIFRITPFVADAPWQLTQRRTGPTPFRTWTLGNTESGALPFAMLPQLPIDYVLNNTIGKRFSAADPGYVQYTVTLTTFDQSDIHPVLNSTYSDYNYTIDLTEETLEMNITVTGWDYLAQTNPLRLNIALGSAADGEDLEILDKVELPKNESGWKEGNLTHFVEETTFVVHEGEVRVILPQAAFAPRTSPSRQFQTVDARMTDSNIISVVLPPPQNGNGTQMYSFYIAYTYIAPPINVTSSDSDGRNLLPLWIVIGVVGGLICIILIIAAIIAVIILIITYRTKKEVYVEKSTATSENMLRDML